MRGLISFHPVDPAFLEDLILPLVRGEKVNPEAFLERARSLRRVAWRAAAYRRTLSWLLESLEPPPPSNEGSLWNRVRSRLERFDYRPDALACAAARRLDPALHLTGRPFLMLENSAQKIALLCDEFQAAADDSAVDALAREQLTRLDPALATIEPVEQTAPGPALAYRAELLAGLKEIYDVARAGTAAEQGELPWRALLLHSHAVPCWVAQDVDGLGSICLAAEVELPGCFRSGRSLLADPAGSTGGTGAAGLELQSARDLGVHVPASEIPELLDFLVTEGARIIQAATQHGVGQDCATLLKKIRECAQYAAHHGVGYVEASGICPPDRTSDFF